jgi:hypothetical protein
MSAETPSLRVEASSQQPQRSAPPHGQRSIKYYRHLVKKAVTSMRWEMSMFVIVIIYMVIVFFTFALADQKVSEQCPKESGTPDCTNPSHSNIATLSQHTYSKLSSPTHLCLRAQQIARLICGLDANGKNTGWITVRCKKDTIARNDLYFTIVDFAFLVFFSIEILIKFFGLGKSRWVEPFIPNLQTVG